MLLIDFIKLSLLQIMSKQEFLEQYLINFEYLDGIILSDKDGIELYSAYKLNLKT